MSGIHFNKDTDHHGHGHDHDHGHGHGHGHDHAGHDHAHAHAHAHDHSHGHDHTHDHTHSHDHAGHDHGHGHSHDHHHPEPYLPDETPVEAHCEDHSCAATVADLTPVKDDCCSPTGGCSDPKSTPTSTSTPKSACEENKDSAPKDTCCSDKDTGCASKAAPTVAPKDVPNDAPKKDGCCSDKAAGCSSKAALKDTPKDSCFSDKNTGCASKHDSANPNHESPDPLRSKHVHKPCRKANCVTRERRRADRTMCTCCVKSMMEQENVSFVQSLMDAAMQVQIATRRCCIAFAAYCCPRPEDCAPLVGQQKCCPEDDELVPLLQQVRKEAAVASDKPAAEVFSLEISGMDCPDCLNKVRKAFDSLPGASIRKIDYIRAIVEVERQDDAADAEIIGKFVARVSGFGVRVIYSAPSDGPRSELPVRFERMPPIEALGEYDTVDIRDNEVVFAFRRGADQISPREILSRLEEYGPSLAPPGRSREEARINKDVRSLAIRTLLCALLTIPILVMVWSPVPHKGALGYRAAEFALATGVFLLAYPIYAGSFRTIWYLRQADLGVLTAVSTLTTYIFSIVAFGFQAAGDKIAEPFFETLGLLITLIYLGRTVQASTRKAALSAISSLSKLQPERAVLVIDEKEQDVDARLLFYGDTVRVAAGSIIPTDGVVFSGSADIDESAITGESVPVVRGPGQIVHAGTAVLDGSVDLAVSRLTGENSLASVIHAVMDAQSSNSRYSDFADRFAARLLPIASFVAVASFIVWLLVLRHVRKQAWGQSVLEAITYAIAVMAVACPCALTLAVPLISATVIAMGVKDGVVFRSSEALLTLSTIRSFAFDKTGTLSLGTLSIVEAYTGHHLASELVTHMTASSRHPVSIAVNQYLSKGDGDNTPSFAIEYESVAGGGMRGDFYGYPVLGGSAAFTGMTNNEVVRQYLDSGYTVFVVTLGGKLVAAFGLADKERAGAGDLVKKLKTRGASVVILSGDHQAAVSAFARRIGTEDALGGLSPTGKADALEQLGKTAFVGDGVNDSIALSKADIGIGMGSGTDAAVLASSIVLLGTDLYRSMSAALDLATSARRHAFLGLAWCALYFTVALLLASGATVNARIPPQYAGLGELVSVLPIILLAASAWAWRRLQRRQTKPFDLSGNENNNRAEPTNPKTK